MKSFITKLKSALGEPKSEENVHDDSFTEAIINEVEGAPFAISETNVLYAGFSELAGYHYFKTIIIGTFQIKTFKGATLIIKGKDFKLELKSDMEELETESSNTPNRKVSRIDFEIDPENLSKISKTTIDSIEIIAKKNHVKFSIIEGGYDVELQDDNLVDEGAADDTVTDAAKSNEEE